MNLEQFFDVVLPKEGFRCLAKPFKNAYAHQILEDNGSAARRAHWLSRKGGDIYFACSTLREKSIIRPNAQGVEKKMYRVRENLLSVKSFWLDLDVRENKGYRTKQEALQHLFEFLKVVNLPTPLIVDSGFGYHVYFPLSESINVDMWVKVANLLHSLVMGFGLLADSSRTRDPSSVLRPIGTCNFKHVGDVRTVQMVSTKYDVSEFLNFAKALVVQLKRLKFTLLKKSNVSQRAAPSQNSDLSSGLYENNESAHQVAEKCEAIRFVRDVRGNVQEPLWYGMIGLLRHTIEGRLIIHEWSSGHPTYSYGETESKIDQHENTGLGPTTCDHLAAFVDASVCGSCTYRGTITSPIQLGKPDVAAPSSELLRQPVPETEDVFAPKDVGLFELTTTSVKFKNSFEPGQDVSEEEKVILLDYPLIVTASAEDELKGGVFRIAYKHPSKGESSFYVDKSVLAEKSVLNRVLLKNHIALNSGKVDLMQDYLISHLQQLDRQADLQMLYSTMGWKKSSQGFVLGQRYISKDSMIQEAPFYENSFCTSVLEKGSVKSWANATAMLAKPGYELHAMSLLFGFGAPLMRTSGYDGALINMLGRTNAGKSTMLEWVASIFGDYRGLKALKKDTYNSLMSRLGTLNNLPLLIDELTNMKFDDVSDLVYSITEGREKSRLTKKSTELKPKEWSTLVICTSNASLADKLMASKTNPEAEKMRLIEYWMSEPATFKEDAQAIYPAIRGNYGTAGTLFIQYLVNNMAAVELLYLKVHKTISDKSNAAGKERFWIAAFSAAFTGGLIAQKIGLLQFDVSKVMGTCISTITQMRGEVVSESVSYSSILGRYLNENLNNILYLNYTSQASGKRLLNYFEEPRYEIAIRVEHDTLGKRIFADKRHFLKWLQDANVPTTEFIGQSRRSGLMVSVSRLVVLGADWPSNPSNSKVPTMEFYCKEDSSNVDTVDIGSGHISLVS